jgi:hypothetical protein
VIIQLSATKKERRREGLRSGEVETLRGSFPASLRKRPCGSSGEVEMLRGCDVKM